MDVPLLVVNDNQMPQIPQNPKYVCLIRMKIMALTQYYIYRFQSLSII